MIYMRLLHPITLSIVATNPNIDFTNSQNSRKQTLSHAWSEVHKFLATNQQHPKMFISDNATLGAYMRYIYELATLVGCNFNPDLLKKYPDVWQGYQQDNPLAKLSTVNEFDELYLMSDCQSLYLKGLNIMPFIYGGDWRRIVPIENLSEIRRIVNKEVK